MELFICRGTNVRSKISSEDKNGNVVITDIYEVNTKSQDTLLRCAVEDSDPTKFSIVLHYSMVSILSPDQVTEYIKNIVDKISFDVFYLSRYADECREHDDFNILDEISTMRVYHPHGVEALILSPIGKQKLRGNFKMIDGRGTDYILNSLGPKMENYSCWPLVYNFDMSKRTNAYDLIKTVVCRESAHSLRPPSLTQKNTSSMNLFWFIMVLIFIFCVAGAFLMTTLDEKGNYIGINKLMESSQQEGGQEKTLEKEK